MAEVNRELLAAAILELVRRYHKGNYVGHSEALTEQLEPRWKGNWSSIDVEAALDLIRAFRGLRRSQQQPTASFVSINYDGASKAFNNAPGLGFNPHTHYKLLSEYFQFGSEWLSIMWNTEFPVSIGPQSDGHLSSSDLDDAVPAADRIVRRSDNSAGADAIDSTLAEIEAALGSNNEAFSRNPDARSAAIAEVSALRRLWDAASLRLHDLKVRSQSVLTWVAEKSATVAIGELCKHAIKLILGWP